MDRWLVVGSALYWAAVGLRFTSPISPVASAWGIWGTVARYLFLLLVLVFSYVVLWRAGVRRGRIALASAALVADCVQAVGSLTTAWEHAYGVSVALTFFVIGTFMPLWGLAFASFDKRRAAQNVIATILLAVLLMLAAMALDSVVATALASCVFYGISAVIVLMGHVPCASHERERVLDQRRHEVVTVLQRLAFGVALTVCSGVAYGAGFGAADAILLAMAIAVLGGALALAFKSAQGLYTALPSLLFVAVGALYLPFFDGGLPSAVWVSAGIIWIAWSAFSAVQLSDLKERYGMSELSICLLDKLALAVGFVLGALALVAIDGCLDGMQVKAVRLCVFAATMALVLGSAYAMARLVGARQEDAARDELARTREERLGAVYGRIAGEFGFSRREREVMEMLAKGYTGVYICEELGVSTGTVKAHTAHIYQKLGIHRKDELLELIDERMANA